MSCCTGCVSGHGSALTPGNSITNGAGHVLDLQGDGNLVVYGDSRAVLFASGTSNGMSTGMFSSTNDVNRLELQSGDNNLVLYHDDGYASWSSQTTVSSGHAILAFFYTSVCVVCLLYTSPSPRDATLSRMPSSA